jgi:hypothetical protein
VKDQPQPPLQVGEPFSPHMLFFGSFMPDCIMSHPTLKDGSKLLLARLYKFVGKKAVCNPSLATLARELGTSEDKIGRSLDDLREHGFVRTVRHARSQAERLVLWHPDLAPSLRPEHESAIVRDHFGETAEPRDHTDDSAEPRTHMNPQNRGDESAKTTSMNPQNGPPTYKERARLNQRRESEKRKKKRESKKPFSGFADESVKTRNQKNLSSPLRGEGDIDQPPTSEQLAIWFADLWEMYPPSQRQWRRGAIDAFYLSITTRDEYQRARALLIERIEDGAHVPNMSTWLRTGGASGHWSRTSSRKKNVWITDGPRSNFSRRHEAVS